MREQTLRASSSYPDRAEYRQGHGKAKSSGTRSRRGTNLGLLGRELGGLDLLGAALGLSSEAVNILVDGRDHAREHQYGAHLAARLKDAGIPATWLDHSNPQISPAYLSALRKFAAASNNKAPIRRANFRRIARAFDGREQVLADALEMVVSAVSNVTEGQLELDDGRFGHMNPILMRAGFPDGWLEQAEPDLTEAMLLSLEQLATDDYERKFEEAESTHTGQVFVSPPPEPEQQKSVQPTAAPVDKSKETVMAPKSQQQTPPPAPFQTPAPEFKAGGMPTGGRPMAHPSAGAARVPRTVLAAGRKLPGAGPAAKTAAGTKPAAKANSAPTPAPQASQTPAPAPASTAAQAPAPTPAAAQAAPDNRRGPNARGTVSKEASLARAEALEKLLENARRGAKAALWRDVLGSSLAFWGNIRRGAVLFRNELASGVEQALGLPSGWLDNPTFPPPPLAAFMSDKDAPVPPRMALDGISDDGAQSADQDGTGTDANAAAGDVAPAPTPAPAPPPAAKAGASKASGAKAGGGKAGAGAPARDATKPFARSAKPQAPQVKIHQQPPSTPPVFPGAAAAAGTPAPAAEGAGPAVDPNTEGRQLLLVDMGTPAPGVSAGAAAQVAATPAATIAPAAAPIAGQPGPLTQALMSIITAKATAGTFTEADALGLINKLMAQ